MRKGLEELAIVPVTARTCPVAVKMSVERWWRKIVGEVKRWRKEVRLTSTIPWELDQRESLAPDRFRYRAVFISAALVIAGLGELCPALMKCWRTSAAAPAAAGVEWLVPEEAV